MSTFNIKQGDYHRQLALDLTDLITTGATSATCRMKARTGGTVMTPDAAITSASRITVTFVAPQLATPGTFDLEVSLVFGDGQETVPTSGYTTVVVEARLA